MSKLRELADKIRQENEKKATKSQKSLDDIYADICAAKTIEFIKAFEMFIPMFKEEGITFSYHRKDKRAIHLGGYIEFKQGNKTLRMDYDDPERFRLEYVPLSNGANYGGSMHFGNWINTDGDRNRFILFIVEGLIEQPETPDGSFDESTLKDIEASKPKSSNINLSDTKIKVTPMQSRKVQEYAFIQRFKWSNGGSLTQYIDKPYLYFSNDGRMKYGDDEEIFNSEPHKLITYSDIFPDEKTER